MKEYSKGIYVKFKPEEVEILHDRMKEAGVQNMSAYIRKMAINGYVIIPEWPDLNRVISLHARISNNLNQYAKKATAMQIDGYSLEAQKTKMKAYCDYNEYEIAGEYEDAGKSGKSIEGRIAFNQMMDDIKSGKDRQGVLKVYLKESKKQKCKLIIS